MLSMTKVEVDLIQDVDIYLFFEKGMRGNVLYTYTRHSKTDNKYLTSYDPKKLRKSYILGQKILIRLCYVKISSNKKI